MQSSESFDFHKIQEQRVLIQQKVERIYLINTCTQMITIFDVMIMKCKYFTIIYLRLRGLESDDEWYEGIKIRMFLRSKVTNYADGSI